MARPSWDFPRSPAALRGLLATAAVHGATTAECLRGTGLDITVLDIDQLIRADQELAVARNLLVRLGDHPGLGVEAGLHYNLTSMGMLGYAMLSSRTVREAITVGIDYLALSSAFVRFDLAEADDQAVLTIDDSEIPADIRPFLVERDLASVLQVAFVSFSSVLPIESLSVALRLDAQRCARLTEYSGGLMRATPDTAVTRIRFARTLLDQPLSGADEETLRACLRQCESILDGRRRRSGLSAVVRARLLADPRAMPSIAGLAEELGLSQRTLRRRLIDEQTSYRALVDEVREGLAMELLTTTQLSIEQIAHRLGYSETAAFTHAFARWRGAPPGSFRR
ncbi:AraC family transcriptional regulator ligand-binding domain-containing protein [Nocardia sp. NPDC056100]|uniref:AraC family transcriptional regulator n=1 Tax=Nocardia sp. NPDC056100 TaxID=3345712 RepID=UPI0035DAC5AA